MSETSPSDVAHAALGSAFVDLGRLVLSVPYAGGVEIPRVVEFAARAVPHTGHAGLTLIRPHSRPETVAATDTVCEQVDALQYETGEGPCLEAIAIDDVCRSDDLITESRWPHFTELAVAKTPVRSMIGLRLVLSGGERAALNFYAETARVFDEVDIGVAAMFCSYLSQSLQREAAERKAANLEIALSTSRQIGAAMGILMSRELMTFDEAFARLRSASQRLHRKLRDVAAEVVDTGQLPT